MNWLSRIWRRGTGKEKPLVTTRHITRESTKLTPAHVIPWILAGVGVILLVERG
jgi:hypothetical protein